MSIKTDTFFTFFRPLSPIYSKLMSAREKMYLSETFKSTRFEVPVVSIGNLTMGGTGKTPLVIHLAEHFKQRQYRPAVISRGYKGEAENSVNVVSDYQQIYLTSKEAGDEPRLIAESLPGIPVLTGIKRKHPCKHAISAFGCDLLLLDDGFQHLGVQRDIDIVLFNAQNLKKNFRVFPGGDLRENFSALQRSSCIVFTGMTDELHEDVALFIDKLKSHGIDKPSFYTSLGQPLFHDLKSRFLITPEKTGGSYLSFCGIGNPERFKDYLLQHEIPVDFFRSFNDHHIYSQQDVDELEFYARQNGIRALLTTEKDGVKLRSLDFTMPVFTTRPELIVDNDLLTFIDDKLASFFHRQVDGR